MINCGRRFGSKWGSVLVIIILLAFTECHVISDHVYEQGVETVNSSNQAARAFKLTPSSKVPLYQFVRYITNMTQQFDPKVYDIHIKQFYFYTNIHLASSTLMNKQMSVVALKDKELIGANMLFSVSRLGSMYAPAEIADVLDFVIPCYAASRPSLSGSHAAQSFVSPLRATSSLDVNKAIIAETTRMLREKTPIGSYHLLWENRTEMDDFLHQTGYQRLYCGNQLKENPCDWTKMKLPASVAENLCIYRWTNTKTVTSVDAPTVVV